MIFLLLNWIIIGSDNSALILEMPPRSTCTKPLAVLQWRQNGRDGVSNQQYHNCLLNRLFRRRSKNTWKLRVTGLLQGFHRWPVNSPHKGPVTRKMFPFDDVIREPFNPQYRGLETPPQDLILRRILSARGIEPQSLYMVTPMHEIKQLWHIASGNSMSTRHIHFCSIKKALSWAGSSMHIVHHWREKAQPAAYLFHVITEPHVVLKLFSVSTQVTAAPWIVHTVGLCVFSCGCVIPISARVGGGHVSGILSDGDSVPYNSIILGNLGEGYTLFMFAN